jgi:UPF0755 protein
MLSIMLKKRRLVIGIICAVVLGLVILLPKGLVYLASTKSSINTESKFFYIKERLSLVELANRLEKEGFISDKKAFITVGEYKGIAPNEIALGKYKIQPATSFRMLLNGFTLNSNGNGNAEVEVEVTFNNCITINDLAEKVSKSLFIDSAKLIALLKDSATLTKYGFTAQQFPAMFIPNTYKFYYDTDEKQFVERMAKEFKLFWTNDRKAKMKNIGLSSPSQVVTLASIVYSEQSIVSKEWPIIAGLYLNRLKKGVRLQSDPTFKFCWGDKLVGVQRLLNVHRDIDCEYNTYKINGLPPGPICFPSSKVVDAVLNRSNVDYIYMCAKPDYSHCHDFAVSGADHVKNAKVFQNWLAGEIKKKEK